VSEEKQEPPLYEALDDVFDFTDAELWKSNSFAAIRPRLIVLMRYVITKLETQLAYTAERASKQPFAMGADKEERQAQRDERKQECEQEAIKIQRKLDRARDILKHLEA
jgi:hypothetical protein